MLSVQDLVVRLRSSGRALAAVAARPRRPGLPSELEETLGRLRAGAGGAVLEAAARALLEEGVDPHEVVTTLGRERPWFRPFMLLLELGERRGVWQVSELAPGATGPIGCVWETLKAEGVAAVLAVYLDRFLRANGRECFQEALALMQGTVARERVEAPSMVAGEEAPPSPAAPQALTSVEPSAAEGEEADEEVDELEDLEVDEEPREPLLLPAAQPDLSWLTPLLALNVNQCREKTSTAGWLTKGVNPELFLMVDQVPREVIESLRSLGLLAGEAQGHAAGARGFIVRAGKLKFPGVAAIDLVGLRELAGARFQELTRTYHGASARTYEVTVLGPCGAERSVAPVAPAVPAAAAEESPGEEASCPRCGSTLRKKRGVAAFWVCSGGCGFAGQAGEDGQLAAPQPCPKCGGPAYATMDSKKRIRPACLQKCGGSRKEKEAA